MSAQKVRTAQSEADTVSSPTRSKLGIGGLGAVLVLIVSLLAVDEKTKLALSALAPIVAVWITDVLQKVGRWWGDAMRKNERERQFKSIEAHLQSAISNTETSEEHRKELVAELEALQKQRLKDQKDALERLAISPDKERSAAA